MAYPTAPLTSSLRATLFEEIAKRLSAKDWPIVDSTLQAFSLPVEGSWGGNSSAYILSNIREASDIALVELAAHLGFALNTKSESKLEFEFLPSFWEPGMFRLFITHLAVHRETAADLKDKLLQCGISSFVAHSDIEPTKEWLIEIERALSSCEALVALLHPKFTRVIGRTKKSDSQSEEVFLFSQSDSVQFRTASSEGTKRLTETGRPRCNWPLNYSMRSEEINKNKVAWLKCS
jgi:hypothetical protein